MNLRRLVNSIRILCSFTLVSLLATHAKAFPAASRPAPTEGPARSKPTPAPQSEDKDTPEPRRAPALTLHSVLPQAGELRHVSGRSAAGVLPSLDPDEFTLHVTPQAAAVPPQRCVTDPQGMSASCDLAAARLTVDLRRAAAHLCSPRREAPVSRHSVNLALVCPTGPPA